ncbi:MAG: hypothetical protein AAGG81_03515, partial [Chlamydiota bacterium]
TLEYKRDYLLQVIEDSDDWLSDSPSDETSIITPNTTTLQQRGVALLQMREEIGNERFAHQFDVLLEHYSHRNIIPHQLLMAFNSLRSNSIATLCHLQMARANQPMYREPDCTEILQLSTLIKPVLKKLGYEESDRTVATTSEVKQEAVRENLSAPVGDPMVLTGDDVKDMKQVDEELYHQLIAYIHEEITSAELRTFINQSKYREIHDHLNEKIKGNLGLDGNSQDGVLLDDEMKYRYGWMAFLLELLEAENNRATTKMYQYLGICDEYGFRPPLEHLFSEILGDYATKENKIKLKQTFQRFNYKDWKDYQRILVLLELKKPGVYYWKDSFDGSFSVKKVCQIIREVMGNRDLDSEFLNAVKNSKGSIAIYRIRFFLSKGAKPDLVYEYKTHKNVHGYALGNEEKNIYLLHRFAELRRPDVIRVFAEYGADFDVGNFYDMNPLEHLLCVRPVKDNSDDTQRTISALINGGIDPDKASGSISSAYNGYKGANPLVSGFEGMVTTLYHFTPFWGLGQLDKKAMMTPYHFAGCGPRFIARWKEIPFPF